MPIVADPLCSTGPLLDLVDKILKYFVRLTILLMYNINVLEPIPHQMTNTSTNMRYSFKLKAKGTLRT